jgi:hypothetical protein
MSVAGPSRVEVFTYSSCSHVLIRIIFAASRDILACISRLFYTGQFSYSGLRTGASFILDLSHGGQHLKDGLGWLEDR